MRTFRLGTRGSKLALWQAEHVAARLSEVDADIEIELVTIRTTGDKRQDVPLRDIGDKSLFIKEIEAALLDGSIDFAVHSLKDVPSRMDERFELAAILDREDPRDVLLTRDGAVLADLGSGAHVGTSSLRREAQLRAGRPDLDLLPLRGNVDTRLRKLEAGDFEAIVLAAAGLHRLGISIPDGAYLDPEICLPSPGQAAICVETLAGAQLASVLSSLDHAPTRRAVEAERTFAAALDAGCRVPVAAYAHAVAPTPSLAAFAVRVGPGEGWGEGSLVLHTLVASPDGSRIIRTQAEGTDPKAVGQEAAEQALREGAAALLALA